jgi:hypothetical protein
MHPLAVAQLLILLTLANGSPVVAKLVLGRHFAGPLDGGAKFIDGKPLLGRSKTVRGLLIAIVVTSAAQRLSASISGSDCWPARPLWPATCCRAS